MSKKKTPKFYVITTKHDAAYCETWKDAEQTRNETKGATIKGGYATREEALAAIEEHLQTVRAALISPISPYVTEALPGRVFDVYACGVYQSGKYGGGFAVFEGETLIHSGRLQNPHNSVKTSGKWAGLFHAILHGTRWAKENGADSVLIHTNTTGPAELVAGVHKPGKEITRDFVAAMVPFRESARFAPIPEKPDEGLKIAERLANEAAGLVES